MICLNCPTETSNPKFCSRSCAALYNNQRKDVKRRSPEGCCRSCGCPLRTRETWCAPCKPTSELVLTAENSNYGKNPYVRRQARQFYIASKRPLSCAICSYSPHVDICHIKDIRSYPIGTLYSDVNAPDNLIALCKNHHWEFDHGLL